MKNLIIVFLSFVLLCSISAQTIPIQKRGKTGFFDLKKLVVVGLTDDTEARMVFENLMKKRLKEYGIIVYQSIEVYPIPFTIPEKAEEEVHELIHRVRPLGFDGLIITAVSSVEEPKENEKEENVKEENGTYKIYHMETQVYDIVPKDLSLLWGMCLDIYEYELEALSIQDYVNAITIEMEYENILPGRKKIKQFSFGY